MIFLTKAICGINILICIEEHLFKHRREQFDSIFSTFKVSQDYSDNMIKMFIFSADTNKNKFEADCKFHYDMDSKSSYFYLANFVEEFISHVLCCTTIHGSLVQVFEKNILIIGSRKSGKTTLTTFLVKNYNAKYLDDDHIYIRDGMYLGFNMPIFLRSSKAFSSPYTTFDEENVCRTAFIPTQKIQQVADVDIIIFPHYSADLEGKVQQLSGTRLFRSIMDNIRFYNTQVVLLNDIAKLSNCSTAYDITYSSYNWIDKLIK